jgi:hypothetical protein
MMQLIKAWTKNIYVCVYVSSELGSFFLLARFGRKTDGHIKTYVCFLSFLCFFAYRQGLIWIRGQPGNISHVLVSSFVLFPLS